MAGGKPDTWTVLNLINWTKDYFARCGVESPRLSAEVLLAGVMRCERITLYTRYDYQPKPDELDAYRQAVKRLAEGEPLAYITGSREFYSLSFRVTRDVLVPRCETELLVDIAVKHLKSLTAPPCMWDVCTGSGCVAIAAAAQVAEAKFLATDISDKAVAVAKQNAESLNVADRVTCLAADMLALPGDWTGPKTFDVITANPPYVAHGDDVAETVKREPAIAVYAGPDGLECIRRIVADAPALLNAGGILAFEFGCGQADEVRDLIVATGRFNEPQIIRDYQQIERAAVATRV